MKELKGQFLHLKEHFKKVEKKDQAIREAIKEILTQEVGTDDFSSLVSEFYLKNKTLFIKTTHKALAQDLYWRREELQKKVNKNHHLVDQVVVF